MLVVRCLFGAVAAVTLSRLLSASFHLLFTLPATPALSSQITGILVIGTDKSYLEVNLGKCFCDSLSVRVCICLSEFIIGTGLSTSHLISNPCICV